MALPAKYQTAEEMLEVAAKYFQHEKDNVRVPTMTGLTLYLGFKTRKSLMDNKQRGDDFMEVYEWCRLQVEAAMESELINRPANVTGLIFSLKNNFDWKDKQELDHGGQPDNPIQHEVASRPPLTREEWEKKHGLDTTGGASISGD